MTRSGANKLGERLRKEEPPSVEALRQLHQFRAEHDAPLARVEDVLRDRLGLQPTPRLKTVTTIVEKLRRGRVGVGRGTDGRGGA